jgi:hypothetical protein
MPRCHVETVNFVPDPLHWLSRGIAMLPNMEDGLTSFLVSRQGNFIG